MRSWRPLLVALLIVVGCSDDTQEPLLQLAKRHNGQPGWQWSNPKPQGNDLNDVDFFDQDLGYAVGPFGAIVCTLDGGTTWELQNSGTTDWLFGVAANGARGAVAVGANGIILRTINRGATWERRQSGVSAGLQDVDFADANHGIAVGKGALRTSDGGLTWSSCDCDINMERVCMVDANTAFAVGHGSEVYSTLDGGASWVSKPTGVSSGPLPFGIWFTDAETGTIVGNDGVILRTTDGGSAWKQQESHTSAYLRGVAFADANHGIAVGQVGGGGFGPLVLYTSDAGATWKHEVNGSPVERVHPLFNAVSMLNADTGVVVGMAGGIIRTTDGGVNWSARTHEGCSRLFALSFGSANDGVAVGLLDILRTRDGGATWTRLTDERFTLTSVTHFSPSGVIATGGQRTMGGTGSVILRSTDSGGTWTPVLTGAAGTGAVDFADESIGTSVGTKGGILRTVDSGVTWIQQTSGTTEDLRDVSLPSASIGIAVGSNATILRTTNRGALWQIQPHPDVNAQFRAVDFADSDVGFVIGNSEMRPFSNTILRTTDGGATWVAQQSGVDESLIDVVCVDRKSAAILTRLRVMTTNDGGEHWTSSEALPMTEAPWALAMSGNKIVTVAGGWGAVLQNHHIFP